MKQMMFSVHLDPDSKKYQKVNEWFDAYFVIHKFWKGQIQAHLPLNWLMTILEITILSTLLSGEVITYLKSIFARQELVISEAIVVNPSDVCSNQAESEDRLNRRHLIVLPEDQSKQDDRSIDQSSGTTQVIQTSMVYTPREVKHTICYRALCAFPLFIWRRCSIRSSLCNHYWDSNQYS